MLGAVDGTTYLNAGVYFNTVVSMGMNGSHSARGEDLTLSALYA
jgi:hypothetical protein